MTHHCCPFADRHVDVPNGCPAGCALPQRRQCLGGRENDADSGCGAGQVIAFEQGKVDFAYACYEAQLAGMSDHDAANASASGKDSVAVAQVAQRHAAEYGGLGDEALVISHVDVLTGDGLESWYIGRRSVSDADSERVVLSWTSPLAKTWFDATPDSPGDVVLKRQLLCLQKTVEGYIDEISIVRGAPADTIPAPREAEADEAPAEAPPLPTPADLDRFNRRRPSQPDELLLRELLRARGGRMRDIVETIRRDQMALVTGSPSDVLIVQGGPGTGKSAVGLHRVTWLVNNGHFAATDILVVGPHQRFLDYVGRVLPTLGTRDIAAVQLTRLWDGDIRGTDPPAAARAKSDERMAAVLHRRVERECRPDALDGFLTELAYSAEKLFAVTIGSTVLRIPRTEMLALVEDARTGTGALRDRRDLFRRLLVDRLLRELAVVAPRRGREASMRRDLERNRQVERLIERVWGNIGPREALRTLYDSPDLLRACGDGILDERERDALRRPRAGKAEDEPWTAEDLVCLEELERLISGQTPRRYGHIVVDEAQDLTPMQARSLRRRCAVNGSMTVLGDLAQATGAHTYTDWDHVGSLLSDNGDWRVADLRVSYRVPAEIMAFVANLAQTAAPGLPYPRAVREAGGDAVRIVPTTEADLVAEAVAHTARLLGTTDANGTRRSVAVIVPDGHVGQAIGTAMPGTGDVTVLTATQAKGMEYDHVLVAEPSAIVDDDPAGLRRLYIALTRSTQSLTVVHARPLPAALVDDLTAADPAADAGITAPDEDYPEIGTDFRVRVVGHLGGGRYKVEALRPAAPRPLVLAVRSGSAPPALGDELDVWVLRHESTITEVTTDTRGRNPISPAMAGRYATALGVSAEAAEGIIPGDARARFSDLQGIANRCLRRDQHDWLAVWRLLGAPDKARLAALRDLAAHANRALKTKTFHSGTFQAELTRSGWADGMAAAKAELESRMTAEEPAPAVPTIDAPTEPHHPHREEPDTVTSTSIEPVGDTETVPAADLIALLDNAVPVERRCNTHEAVRHELLAALLRADLQPEFARHADVVCATPHGFVLYEVLGAGRTGYADLRSGAVRLFEVNHTLDTRADRLCLVLSEPPFETWTAEAVRAVFGIEVIWRTEQGWDSAGDTSVLP